MTTEIVSVVGGCIFAGLTMICVAQFFRTKTPAAKRAARQLKQERQDNLSQARHCMTPRAQ